VKSGRYGAYVTAGGINATIPNDKTQDTITLPEAIALIDERAAKGGGKPKRAAKKAKPADPKKNGKAGAAAKKPAKKATSKQAPAKPKSEAVSKARGSIAAAKPPPNPVNTAAKTKKSAGKNG
jgi:DNA topoisomerase-1